jgi:hypothetical protein
MVGFFNLVYDAGMSPKDLLPEKKEDAKNKPPVTGN